MVQHPTGRSLCASLGAVALTGLCACAPSAPLADAAADAGSADRSAGDTAAAEDGPAPLPDAATAPDVDQLLDDGTALDHAPYANGCPWGTACNALPDDAGLCPGTCVDQPSALTCRGAVLESLCFGNTHPQLDNPVARLEGVEVRAIQVPDAPAVGETHDMIVELRNVSRARLERPLGYQDGFAWEILSTDLDATPLLQLEPLQAARFSITARARFTIVTLFTDVVRLSIGSGTYQLVAPVFADPQDGVACGGRHFPAGIGLCCGEVFYPGAACCDDRDCSAGVCSDGRCVSSVPAFASANNLPIGSQSFLLVVSDFLPAEPATLCANEYATLAPVYQLDEIATYFDALTLARTGRELLEIEWTALSGIAAADFIDDGDYTYPNFSAQLETYLVDAGCVTSFDAYDKVLIASPLIDLGEIYTGSAFSRGRIALRAMDSIYLMAHELAHTFGATDLYLLDHVCGFQNAADLMCSSYLESGAPKAGVMWNEIGLGDVDRNGVIDVFER